MPNVQEQFAGSTLSYNDITNYAMYVCPYNWDTQRDLFVANAHSMSRQALNKLSAIRMEFGKAKRKGVV